MKITKILTAIFFVLIPQIAGFIGSFFTRKTITTWYVALKKPSFTPKSWIFGPVWTILYLLMGVAAYIVWRAGWEKNEVKILTAEHMDKIRDKRNAEKN